MKRSGKSLGLIVGVVLGWVDPTSGADAAQAMSVVPGNPEAVAAKKTVAEKAPKGAKLAAYLDCGTQRESASGGPLRIVCVSARPHQFQSEAPGVPATQATVFFDAEQDGANAVISELWIWQLAGP